MADYNFLSLVNDIADSMNEVRIEASDFGTAQGFYGDAKNAVNNAIRRINQDGVEWPFNHATVTLPLVKHQVRYDFPNDFMAANFDSFRVVGDLGVNRTVKLGLIDYENYIAYQSDMEYNPSQYHGVPRRVFRSPALGFGVTPPPDKEYTLIYEYYKLPVDLVLWSDTPSVPENFRYVIREGALYYAYMFRGDHQAAMLQDQKFQDGLKTMRRTYVNRYEHLIGYQTGR